MFYIITTDVFTVHMRNVLINVRTDQESVGNVPLNLLLHRFNFELKLSET